MPLPEARHKGRRSPRRPYKFGTVDIADTTGLSQWTIRRHRQEGQFDPTSLASLSKYIVRNLKNRRATGAPGSLNGLGGVLTAEFGPPAMEWQPARPGAASLTVITSGMTPIMTFTLDELERRVFEERSSKSPRLDLIRSYQEGIQVIRTFGEVPPAPAAG